MDQTLHLPNHVNVIGPTTDYAYKWALNVGLSDEKALRLALAVDELVTDVVRFAFPGEDDTFELTFRAGLSTAEVIIHERGEPFDPARHPYDPERAVDEDNFEGAGFAVVNHCVDDFAFLNRGREGKEFRVVQHIESDHIADLHPTEEPDPDADREDVAYTFSSVQPKDAEDIAKLIYRTYGYTYVREDLYYPERIERALEQGEKFGVVVRSNSGRAVGYFAVLQSQDSDIGEVGEAVVDVNHRRRGLMKRMLRSLIDQANERGLSGVYGEAVTVHDISQRVNHHFGMVSTAMLLGLFPPQRFRSLSDERTQPITVIIDFRPLVPYDTVTAYLPARYAGLLRRIYAALDVDDLQVPPASDAILRDQLPDATEMDARIRYIYDHVVFVVDTAGQDLPGQVHQAIDDLEDENMAAAYVDLPLDDPATPAATELLWENDFVFAGLMPRFHEGRDYLRLQHPMVELDPDAIEGYSDLAADLKSHILNELSWIPNDTETPSQSARGATST
jgi:anti-sigma regulatory factor (Ser/Thr protein kinase)/N-acetylglutamate synthase-like GNAT family acetyltransferase